MTKRWKILGRVKAKPSVDNILSVLLNNRKLVTKKEREEFLHPTLPSKLNLRSVGLKTASIRKAIARISKAKTAKENVVVFGDYDADGICATAILWETLHSAGLKVLPFIPDRFTDGYGISVETVNKLKKENLNLGLIVTVDNGIVAKRAVTAANKLGVDVIITDHHQVGKSLPKAHAIVHTDQISGSGVAWFLAREIRKELKTPLNKFNNGDGLDLAAIGTVADILPLVGPNRSIVKHGLVALNKTTRVGLKNVIKESSRELGSIGTYEIGFVIAPRINAMGRLSHGIEALRTLCTTNANRAVELSRLLGRTNKKRQDVVERVVAHAGAVARKKKWKGAILVADESYHEGVIGLAAAKLVQEHYRPAIVLSVGKEVSKASARSISGFNIIKAIRKFDSLIDGGGGHPMAAGFNIKTSKIKKFIKEFGDYSASKLNDNILTRKLNIDMELNFENLNRGLFNKLRQFQPTGVGNPTPTFAAKDVEIVESKAVGQTKDHVKLTLGQGDKIFKAIAFGFGDRIQDLGTNKRIDIAYNLEENVWNGMSNLELKLKDIKLDE